MIRLVKHQNRNGGKVILANNGHTETQDCGLMLKFQAADNRKPSYAVLIDNDSLEEFKLILEMKAEINMQKSKINRLEQKIYSLKNKNYPF